MNIANNIIMLVINNANSFKLLINSLILLANSLILLAKRRGRNKLQGQNDHIIGHANVLKRN